VSFFRRHPIIGVVAVMTMVFMWLPLAVVMVNSLNKDPLLARWGGLTMTWFGQAFRDPAVRDGLVSSLEVGLLTAGLSLIVALTGVLWWRRASSRGRRVFDAFAYARLVIPEVVFATALFLVFTRSGIQLGMMATVIGHTVWASAYATVILQARVRLLDPAVEEAAADLGASPAGVFFRVTLRQMLPGIIAAGVLAFTLSFDDVVTTFFLSGPQLNTLPLLVLGLIRFRVTPEVNAIGALVTMSMIASTLLVVWLLGRSTRKAESVARRLGY
jgi:ABC-type spermidine/putrescine transport system permease subunit II